jgi:hypothetical protein
MDQTVQNSVQLLRLRFQAFEYLQVDLFEVTWDLIFFLRPDTYDLGPDFFNSSISRFRRE